MKTPMMGTTLIAGLIALTVLGGDAVPPSMAEMRWKALKAQQNSNFKDAFTLFSKLALDRDDDPRKVGNDLVEAVHCLQSLNRLNEFDTLVEKVIAAHSNNWRLLQAAATLYSGQNYWHQGFIIAGTFERGGHRGGGRMVNSWERDRVRALQLMAQATVLIPQETDKARAADFLFDHAQMLLDYRGRRAAWRLQSLTDLATLPDYEEGYYGYYNGGETHGAPVNEDGSPVFHAIPESYTAAQSDGERWRWLVNEAMSVDPGQSNRALYTYATFLQAQFDVQTMMASPAWADSQNDSLTNESGIFAVHTLADDETIAMLATGIKRFKLPKDADFIALFKTIADSKSGGYGEEALGCLSSSYMNRRQFDKSVAILRRSIEHYKNQNGYKQQQVDQVLKNWGMFEPVMAMSAGKGATIEFRFRNATSVSFEAHEVKDKLLLEDIKKHLASNPKELNWQKIDINNIGWRIVSQKEEKYLGGKVAEWTEQLEPRPNHFDKRVTIHTPLTKPGAYMLTAKMPDGNTSKILIWVNDTVIAKKQLDEGVYFYLADAVSGKALPKMNVEFFGYKTEPVDNKLINTLGRSYNILTKDFAESTDAQGQIVATNNMINPEYQWLVIATSAEGRFAYLGFCGMWYGNYYDQEYNQTKVFTITDRPVYRPDQAVKFKFWVRHAKYDQEDTSSFANQAFVVEIHDPNGTRVLEKNVTADDYGGIAGEYYLPKGAPLGVYQLYVRNQGGGTFRVEEYKKPEFEVTVEAPTEPVMLGEKITATVKAKYYFGAPVAKGQVKYKVLRSSYSSCWYPMGIWDWFYGPGYWWFACDYVWYPGWRSWGCCRPVFWWWYRSEPQPEVVAQAEVPIPKDGILKIDIDTAIARQVHGDTDHRYEITAEVTDESRRTITGNGTVLVARKPFKVYAWVDRGHYRVGDVVGASFCAQTLDNKPVKGSGSLNLYRLTYTNGVPIETVVQEWTLATDDQGTARQQMKATQAGQYRLSYKVTDAAKHEIEGGYVFCIMGEGNDHRNYRFNEIELVPDMREYKPGDKVKLAVNVDVADSTVLLFIRPANGICLAPKVLAMKGKSAIEEIAVTKKDMPNFFVEALTIANGKVFTEMREIIVPPEKRVLKVEVATSKASYKPGEKATVDVRVKDSNGEPFKGSLVLSVYDKSVEYISGGSNVEDIRTFFWKWRRQHNPQTESSVDRMSCNLVPPNMCGMGNLGVFGGSIADENGLDMNGYGADRFATRRLARSDVSFGMVACDSAASPEPAAAPIAMHAAEGMAVGGKAMMKMARAEASFAADKEQAPGSGGGGGEEQQPAIRKEFADTAYWNATLSTDEKGSATVEFPMPENLTGWKVKAWAMGHGTKVGEAAAEVVTFKNLLLRMQAPRFFIEKDEVVLSANIHNYLASKKKVRAVLETDGGQLEIVGKAEQSVKIAANGEQRVDWRVKVVKEGEAVVRMKALTDEESDAMQMTFPVYVHGMLKTESFSGVIRPQQQNTVFTINVPADRRINESRLEIRYSPTLAGAMVDALPYLCAYPYGCTEQTLNRFLPTVIVQKILRDMKLDLKAIQEKRSNLNAQEIGDDKERAKQWKRWDRNPVFDEATVNDMVKEGLRRLQVMQCSDGGWGWFSGWGEYSSPHTTAHVVHGLQTARTNGVALVPGVLERGVEWLVKYQDKQVTLLKNWGKKGVPQKQFADELDAFVYMVLADEDTQNTAMRDFLYRPENRAQLAVYGKAMFAMALYKQKQTEKFKMLMQNIEQFLVEDKENQTAYLNIGNEGCWWYWYGSEYEALAYYLKLLALTEPKSNKAAGLVKYLLNNRKHATYWNSTRDTALCIEAMADYLRASGEDKPDMTIEVWIDGQKRKEVKVNADNLFAFDNKFVLEGDAVPTGKHTVELRKTGSGPVYANMYLTYFSLEEYIKKAGLEVKVNRIYYKLVEVDKKIKVAGSRGQAIEQKVEKYERQQVKDMQKLKSGDLIECELTIESKNDYEYLVFEDMKPAGFEPVEVRSGYTGNEMGAYVEFRDEKVCFFVRVLARGKHSVSYKLRAEIPGKFSALPTKGYAMYAPELKANADEIKVRIED